MTGWIIFGSILLLFWLIGMIRANVEVEYSDSVRVAVQVLGVKIRITPKEKKPPKLSDFTPKKYRKRLAKDEKLRLKQEAKKAKKEAAKAKKAAEKKAAKEAEKKGLPAPEKGKKKKEKKKKGLAEIMELVYVGLDALKGLGKSFGKHFGIEAVRMKIAVGSEDAAQTAILYGIIKQFAAYLLVLLPAITNFSCKKPEEIRVTADFLSDKLVMDLHFIFRLRVWHVFAMIFAAGIGAVKRLLKTKMGNDDLPPSTVKKADSPAG